MPGKLYLIPNLIHEDATAAMIPSYVGETIGCVRHFFVEERKAAIRFLKKLHPSFPVDACQFFPLNEHTDLKEAEKFLETVLDEDSGIIPEAGCPCIADPGAEIVLLAQQKGMTVIPLVGPSSIVLGLMASGLNGQSFAFHGYLPKEKEMRRKKIKELEEKSGRAQQTQIFMETPYRNQDILQDILSCCAADTLLCVAADLTGCAPYVKTVPVKSWQNVNPPIHKRPALFFILRRR